MSVIVSLEPVATESQDIYDNRESPTDHTLGGKPGCLPPSQRIGDYEIDRELARGGMGVVYRALDTTLDRNVAIKVLQEPYAADSSLAERFVVETRITAQLEHPAIPPVHRMGTLPDGRPYLAMKLIEGRTLKELIGERESTQEGHGRFLAVFEQVCQAVAYAHSRAIIHRDLKPDNVMVGVFGEVQVMDWGLAKQLASSPTAVASEHENDSAHISAGESATTVYQGPAENSDAHTRAGDVLGTPAYMPPEQARGELECVDQRSDVFSLGGILCAILTGTPPFEGSGREALQRAARGVTDATMMKLDSCGADPDLVSLCKQCLSPSPDDRPPNAQAVAESISAHLAAAEERARQAELVRVRTVEEQKRRRVQIRLAASVIGLLIAVGVGVTMTTLWREAADSRDSANAAKGRLATEKKIAEDARDEAERLQGIVEDQRQHLAAMEYGRTIQVAYDEWQDNQVASARMRLASTDPSLRRWEYDYTHSLCHSEVLSWKAHTGGVESVRFSPDGANIVSAGANGTIKIWDSEAGVEVRTLIGQTREAKSTVFGCSTSFSPDGSRIIASRQGGGAMVWEAKNGKKLLTLGESSGVTDWAAFSPDGLQIVTANFDSTTRTASLEVWDSANGEKNVEIGTITSQNERYLSVSFSPDSLLLVTANNSGTATIWDLESGKKKRDFSKLRGRTFSASISPDGKRVLAAGGWGLAKVWDALNGATIFKIEAHTDELNSAIYSPDGTQIVTSSSDGTAKLWDANTGAHVRTVSAKTGPLYFASFSPDGSQIVTAGDDKTARVWDARTGEEILVLKGHTDRVSSAKFSPVGTEIVTASDDESARLWDTSSGSEILVLKGHIGRVRNAAYHPDGSRIVTAGWDGSAKLWDAKSGAEVLSLKGHLPRTPIHMLSLSMDGSRIITAGADMRARVWDSRPLEEVLRWRESIRSSETDASGRLAMAPDPIATIRGWLPSWSPDGTKLTLRLPESQLVIVDVASGSHLQTFDDVRNASWSPVRGGPIAFIRNVGANPSLFVMNENGENQQLIAKGARWPAGWSSNGKTLYFVLDGYVCSQNLGDQDGEAMRLLEVSDPYPAVSPDGSKVAARSKGILSIIDIANGEPIWSRAIESYSFPGWSPDSRFVVWGGGRRDGDGVWILDVERANAFQATPNPGSIVRWSPDGKRIAFDVRQNKTHVKVLNVADFPWPKGWTMPTAAQQPESSK